MADFSFLSDTDESAVEEILAEAADHVTLKQISALNLSGVSDSVLPQHLESRFRRLKTLPSSLPQNTTGLLHDSAKLQPDDKPAVDSALKLTESARHELGSSSSSKPKSRSGSSTGRRRNRTPSPSPSSSESSHSWLETKNSPKLKADEGLFGSDRRSEFVSPKPNKKTTSFSGLWGSAKRALRKLSFSKRSGGGSEFDWRRNDDVLEDLRVGSLSRREQEKILKKAAKEEMKINEEAEKIVKWAKQVSARMEAFDLHDDDEFHYK